MLLPIRDPEFWIRRCLALAAKGAGTVGAGVMVGSVLVRDNCEIACGIHHAFGAAHAERDLLQSFSHQIQPTDTLVINLEPCAPHPTKKTPPCTEIIIERGIRNVVFGMIDPDPRVAGRGLTLLKENGVSVFGPFLEESAKDFNRGFICLRLHQRPWLSLVSSPENLTAVPDCSAWQVKGRSHLFASVLIHEDELQSIASTLSSLAPNDSKLSSQLLIVIDSGSCFGMPQFKEICEKFQVTLLVSASSKKSSLITKVEEFSRGCSAQSMRVLKEPPPAGIQFLEALGRPVLRSAHGTPFSGVASVILRESSPLVATLGKSCIDEHLN